MTRRTSAPPPPHRRRAAATALTALLCGGLLASAAAGTAAAAPAEPGTASAAAAVPGALTPATLTPATLTPATLTEVDVPGTTALSASALDLDALGYTEREFFSEGTAHRYRGATGDASADATAIDDDSPYRTRVLVRAPQADAFNGTLIVEWTNVTIGLDADFVFAEAGEELLRQGFAYAVVSAQKVGVDRLASWSPERYGDLSVDASNVDPEGGGAVDPCGAPGCPGDPLSWDVFTQTAAALTADPGSNPALPGLEVQNVIATGQSQSASRLTAYYNAIQPLAGFFDGFVFWDRATAPLRGDVGAPAISVDSEGLSNVYPAFPTSEYTRAWEIAGSTHGSLAAADYVDAMFARDGGLIGPDGAPQLFSEWVAPSCAVLPAFSTVPNGLVISAAVDAVKGWIEAGTAAPPSILFDRAADGTILRDGSGAIEGGVRLSEFTAPTAEIAALNGTAFPCSVSGSHRYYTAEELTARYGTHEEYVAQVTAAMTPLAEAGYVLPSDAQAVIQAAQESDVARADAAPTPAPTPTPSTTAAPSPAGPSATAAPGAAGSGSLAATGFGAGGPVLIGVVLLVAGAVASVLVPVLRRRRSRVV